MSQVFDLLYHIPGITDIGLAETDKREREWLWKELDARKKKEAADRKGRK